MLEKKEPLKTIVDEISAHKVKFKSMKPNNFNKLKAEDLKPNHLYYCISNDKEPTQLNYCLLDSEGQLQTDTAKTHHTIIRNRQEDLLNHAVVRGYLPPYNLFFKRYDDNNLLYAKIDGCENLIRLLNQVDETANKETGSAYDNEKVIKLLRDYINQLERLQTKIDEYSHSKSKKKRNEVADSFRTLRTKADALHAALLSKPARYVTPITTFIGATMGLVLAPVALIAGVLTTLSVLILFPCLANNDNADKTRSKMDFELFFYFSFLTFPLYSIFYGANLGHRAGEHCFFSEPRPLDDFRKETMNGVRRYICDTGDEKLERATADFVNNWEFDFYIFS